jgi:hypothetical protein
MTMWHLPTCASQDKSRQASCDCQTGVAAILNGAVGFARAVSSLDRIASYASALAACLRRQRTFQIEDLIFRYRDDIDVPAAQGTRTLIFALEGTGKLYRVRIEPVAETHRASQ